MGSEDMVIKTMIGLLLNSSCFRAEFHKFLCLIN